MLDLAAASECVETKPLGCNGDLIERLDLDRIDVDNFTAVLLRIFQRREQRQRCANLYSCVCLGGGGGTLSVHILTLFLFPVFMLFLCRSMSALGRWWLNFRGKVWGGEALKPTDRLHCVVVGRR
jgi:hypothetical protein